MSMISMKVIIRAEDGEIDRVCKDGKVVTNSGWSDKRGYVYVSVGNKQKAAAIYHTHNPHTMQGDSQ